MMTIEKAKTEKNKKTLVAGNKGHGIIPSGLQRKFTQGSLWVETLSSMNRRWRLIVIRSTILFSCVSETCWLELKDSEVTNRKTETNLRQCILSFNGALVSWIGLSVNHPYMYIA